MMTLVIGGSASGKSEYAESLILCAPETPRVYLATMQVFDDECRRRIRRHREMRAAKRFETVECPTHLENAAVPAGSAVLLECMSNLCANELFSPEGRGDASEEAILRGVERLKQRSGTLVVVSNEVFSGGAEYEGDTLRYLHLLAALNRRMAAMADRVCEVVCGVPCDHKGGEHE